MTLRPAPKSPLRRAKTTRRGTGWGSSKDRHYRHWHLPPPRTLRFTPSKWAPKPLTWHTHADWYIIANIWQEPVNSQRSEQAWTRGRPPRPRTRQTAGRPAETQRTGLLPEKRGSPRSSSARGGRCWGRVWRRERPCVQARRLRFGDTIGIDGLDGRESDQKIRRRSCRNRFVYCVGVVLVVPLLTNGSQHAHERPTYPGQVTPAPQPINTLWKWSAVNHDWSFRHPRTFSCCLTDMSIAKRRPEPRQFVVVQAAVVEALTRWTAAAVSFQYFTMALTLVSLLESSRGIRWTAVAIGKTARSVSSACPKRAGGLAYTIPTRNDWLPVAHGSTAEWAV